jgi:hypothetical protein
VQYFDVRSGRPVEGSPVLERPEDRGYVAIAEPPWYTQPQRQDSVPAV